MLIIATIVFFVSWAPLNLFNILNDPFKIFDNSSKMLTMFALCHLSGMTNVVTNPVMYGFLNDNFRRSIISLLPGCCSKTQYAPRNVRVLLFLTMYLKLYT